MNWRYNPPLRDLTAHPTEAANRVLNGFASAFCGPADAGRSAQNSAVVQKAKFIKQEAKDND